MIDLFGNDIQPKLTRQQKASRQTTIFPITGTGGMDAQHSADFIRSTIQRKLDSSPTTDPTDPISTLIHQNDEKALYDHDLLANIPY